jgi:peroxiredoxin
LKDFRGKDVIVYFYPKKLLKNLSRRNKT